MKKVVVIIGAGPAGLAAGYKLLKESTNYEVIILEESNDIGGISKTVNYKGNRMDIGGHRFFTKSDDVQDFWNEVMPLQGKPSFDDRKLKTRKNYSIDGPNPEKEDNVMLIRKRVSRIFYNNSFFEYPITLNFDTLKNLGFLESIMCGFSYLKSLLFKRKENCLEDFYINRFGKRLYSIFFEDYTEKLWGRHPKDISADWGAQRVKGISIFVVLKDALFKLFHIKKKTVETSLIEDFNYPKLGPGSLWEKVADQIEKFGGKIYKNYKVVKIINKNMKIESVICLNNNKRKTIKGDIFISSMPLKDLINGMKDVVPKKIKKIANGLPYRDFVTVGLLVKKLKLKNNTKIKTLKNIVPDCWIYIQEKGVKVGRLQIFNNWSPYMVKDINNTVWLGMEYFCNENDSFWSLTDKKLSEFAINEITKLGIIEKKDILDYHVERVKKAYPAYFDTYKEIDKLKNYLNKVNNLYCVGRNGQHRYNNMDHSVLTSFEAIKNIINEIDSKDNVWGVNAEKVYHERKN